MLHKQRIHRLKKLPILSYKIDFLWVFSFFMLLEKFLSDRRKAVVCAEFLFGFVFRLLFWFRLLFVCWLSQ
jgi:hypothetical protein